MNDETVLPDTTEPGTADQPASQETQAETAPADDWTVTEPTEETVALTAEVIQAVGSDIIHVNLFGSFLICGVLIGLALWRKIYGT